MSSNDKPKVPSPAEDRKADLEAQLLELDLAQRKADAALQEAKRAAELEEAKQRKQEAENRAKLAGLDHEKYVRAHVVDKLTNDLRVYAFNDHVDDLSAGTLFNALRSWEKYDEADDVKRPILIKFNSPGGSVLDGFDIYDTVMDMRNRGWKIDTLATGIAASMAGILLQMGEERLMNKNATLHMHEIGSLAYGKTSEIKDHVKFTDALEQKGAAIYAERSTLTVEEVLDMWARKETFMSAKEAESYKLIDRIV